jgi:hypothetical protein
MTRRSSLSEKLPPNENDLQTACETQDFERCVLSNRSGSSRARVDRNEAQYRSRTEGGRLGCRTPSTSVCSILPIARLYTSGRGF